MTDLDLLNRRQPAYDAVYAYIRELHSHMPPDMAHRNAIIWHAVDAALDATEAAPPAASTVPRLTVDTITGDQLDALQDEREQLADIVRDLFDDSPCGSFDHHGYCQHHSWLSDKRCPHARAREVLAALDEPKEPTPPRAAATDVVAYRSRGGRLLRCVAHHPGQEGIDNGDFVELTSEDLPDGGVCTFPTALDATCGVDVLITPKEPTP